MNKIITIGDLHGDYKVFIEICKMCKLINNNNNWIGKNTYLIQVGDTLDGKRPGVNMSPEFITESGELEIIELIIKLDSEATKVGGRVISILGNHELYPYYFNKDKNFLRDYVKKADIDKFKSKYKVDRATFFKPGNRGGILLGKTRPLMVRHGKFLFIHGSITDSLIKYGLVNGKVDIVKVNKDVSLWLRGIAKIPTFLKEMNEENPVFSRIYSHEKVFNQSECNKIDKQLEYFPGIEYIVMGHSRFKTINQTCNKALIRTDVSLSRAFGGTLPEKNKTFQALEIIQENNKEPVIRIITPNGYVNI